MKLNVHLKKLFSDLRTSTLTSEQQCGRVSRNTPVLEQLKEMSYC